MLSGTDEDKTNYAPLPACTFTFSFTALPSNLRFRAEACILVVDGYTVWKRSVLGMCMWFLYVYIVICWWKASWNIFLVLTFLFFSIPGYFTCNEHQVDGPDQKETGLYGSSRIKQIRSRCFLAPCCFNTRILISITWLSYHFSVLMFKCMSKSNLLAHSR